MRRRRSALQNLTGAVYPRKSFRFMRLRTLLHSRNSQLLSFQSLAHSLPKTPGGGGTFPNFQTFKRATFKLSTTVSSLECALPRFHTLSALECTVTKKGGG